MHGISRTPVNRALSELAAEGMILRHRRRGSFVNPHWLSRRQGDTEIRVVVPAYGPWEQLIRDAADGVRLNIVRVPRGRAASSAQPRRRRRPGTRLRGLRPCLGARVRRSRLPPSARRPRCRWVRREHDVDFLASLAAADRYQGHTFGVSAFAEVAGLWYSKRKLRALGLESPPRGRRCPPRRGCPGRTCRRRRRWRCRAATAGGETTAYCLIGLLASNGVEVIDDGGIGIGSAASAQTLRFLRRLVDRRLPSPGSRWVTSGIARIHLLADGQAAITIGGTYEAETLAQRTGAGQRAACGTTSASPRSRPGRRASSPASPGR